MTLNTQVPSRTEWVIAALIRLPGCFHLFSNLATTSMTFAWVLTLSQVGYGMEV